MFNHVFNLDLLVSVNLLGLQLMATLEDSFLASDFSQRQFKHILSDTVGVLALDAVHHISLSKLCLEDIGLFALQSIKLALNIWVVKVEHVGTVVELGELIVSPFFLVELVVLLRRDVEVTGASELFLELLNGGSCFLDTLDYSFWDENGTVDVVSLLGLGDMKSVQDSFLLLGVLSLLSESVIKQDVTGLALDVRDSVT